MEQFSSLAPPLFDEIPMKARAVQFCTDTPAVF